MKYKLFKKNLAIVLTMAVLFGMMATAPWSPVSLVTKVEANSLISSGGQYYIRNVQTGRVLAAETTATSTAVIQQDFNANTRQRWRLDRVSGDNYNLVPMSATGSRLVLTQDPTTNGVRARVEPQNQHTTRQQWNITLIGNGNHHVTRISLVGFAARSFRPVNNNTNGSPIEMWDDNQWHNYWMLIPVASVSHTAQVIRDVDIFYDTSYGTPLPSGISPGNHPPIRTLSNVFSGVSQGFSSQFSIYFRSSTPSHSPALNGFHHATDANRCRRVNNRVCDNNTPNPCGALNLCWTADNVTTNHHKSGRRVLGLISHMTPQYVVRVVGHALCGLDDRANHFGLNAPDGRIMGGMGFRPGRDTVVTSENDGLWTLQFLMAHELGHNLSASDCGNICFMNAGTSNATRFCLPCATRVWEWIAI